MTVAASAMTEAVWACSLPEASRAATLSSSSSGDCSTRLDRVKPSPTSCSVRQSGCGDRRAVGRVHGGQQGQHGDEVGVVGAAPSAGHAQVPLPEQAPCRRQPRQRVGGLLARVLHQLGRVADGLVVEQRRGVPGPVDGRQPRADVRQGDITSNPVHADLTVAVGTSAEYVSRRAAATRRGNRNGLVRPTGRQALHRPQRELT
ncbi:hypothetical protein [Actinomadura nitritigenes]|uniref:hypothetical protein n=1 Tax=Actinomadura nitritigenes TaxID=134602 RepID=UPI003D925D83